MVLVIVLVDLNKVSCDDDNFDDDGDPQTNIHVRLMAFCNRYKQWKTCKKRSAKN